MTKEELTRYVELGRGYGTRVDVRLMLEYPGYVRVTSFHRKNKVIIEFYALGSETDAAFEFIGDFPSLGSAISSIESFLEMPIESWHNFSKTGEYLNLSNNINLEKTLKQGHRNLVIDILSHKLNLPPGVNFRSKHELWGSIEEYDKFMDHSKGSK